MNVALCCDANLAASGHSRRCRRVDLSHLTRTTIRLMSCSTWSSFCAVARGTSTFGAALPLRFLTASRTFARPFACMLSFSAAMMLMIGGAGLPSGAIDGVFRFEL